MHVIFRDATGHRTEGILLAGNRSRLRIVVGKLSDTLELRMVEGRWTSEEGGPVEIESLISEGRTEGFSGSAARANVVRN